MADSTLRQRSTKSTTPKPPSGVSAKRKTKNENVSFLDVIRVLATISVAACALSYYLSSGKSYTFGYKPWWTDLKKVKHYFQGPLELTAVELAQYDGTKPGVPIYMAINGTIYDVSASPHMYGPGGGYSVFAGRDATRAFVTGCFAEDRTDDMRGAEEVYLPIDDPNEVISSGERKKRAEKERREAKKKAFREVKKWADFYGNSPKYAIVGRLVRQKPHTGPPPPLCQRAQEGRPRRNNPHNQDIPEHGFLG